MKRWSLLLSVLLPLLVPRTGHGFVHIVQPGETLASISEKFYGKIQNENLLVVANALDAQGGVPIVAGMRLEVPSLTYVRIDAEQTWKSLALKLLGAEHRAHALAVANGSKAWLPPDSSAEVIVPYNLRFVATGEETIVGLAYRFLGDRKAAWMLDHYNGRGGRRLERGEVVLLPIVDIELTEEGKLAAQRGILLSKMEAGGAAREAQRRVEQELGALETDLKEGRYVDAVTRGTRFLASGELSRPQLAQIHRALLEAYAALGEEPQAADACAEWLKHAPGSKLDPVFVSPKLLSACEAVEKPAAKKKPKTQSKTKPRGKDKDRTKRSNPEEPREAPRGSP